MSVPPGIQKRSDPTRQDEAAQDISAKVEELQAEIGTLRRENASLKQAETGRKRAEEALRESKEKYRSLFDSIDEGFCIIEMIFDAEGKPVDYRFLETNRAFERQTGMRNAAGKRMREFVPNHEEHWFEIYGAIAKTGEPRRFTQTAKPLMGGWYDVYAFPYGRPNSNQVAILFNDITERKRAEEALRENEEKYRQLFESMGEGFVLHEMVYDDEGRPVDYLVLDINPAYEKITGLRRGDVIGKGITEIIPVIEPVWFERYDGVVRFGRAMRFEDYNAGLDRWYGVYTFPVRKKNQFAVIFTTITERKQAEMALAAERQRFLAVVESLPVMVCLLTPDYHVAFANRAFREKFGELNGRHCYEYCCGLTEPCPFCESFVPLKTGQPHHWEFTSPDGSTIIDAYDFPFTDIDGSPLILEMDIDITERRRAVEGLMRRTDDLVRLNREVKAARDEANMYLDIMTHDVRNANNVSGMYADLLVEVLAGDQWLYARKLRDAIQRSSEILRNVATIRRLQQESDRLMPVNLDAVVREEIGNFPGMSIRYDGRRVDVLADGLLPVIFTNLIGNAVKFSALNVKISIGVEEQDGEVLVTVADTGPGVPDEMKAKLFRRFERGMCMGKGEGLGLYLVRTLAERYGGKVWVEDRVEGQPEQGAAFKFTLKKA